MNFHLDGKDIGILVALWEQGCRAVELDGQTAENQTRLYRMRRKGLCGCSRNLDSPAKGRRNDPIWGITPDGVRAVSQAEERYAGEWREQGWSMILRRNKQRKRGIEMERQSFVDFFNTTDPDHLKAYWAYLDREVWPPDFWGKIQNLYFPSDWRLKILEKIVRGLITG